jgi:hypothetical protein
MKGKNQKLFKILMIAMMFFCLAFAVNGAITDDNVAWWAMDDESSPYDVYGVTGIAGKINGAFDFNGSTDHAEIPYNTFSSSDLTNISFSFWYNSAFTGTGKLMGIQDWSDPDEAIQIEVHADAFEFLISDADGQTRDSSQTDFGGVFDDGQWHHIVWKITDTRWEFWFDGVNTSVSIDTDNNPDNFGSFGAGDFLCVGCINDADGSGATQYVDVKLDEFRVFTKQLSSTEINSLYNSGSGTETALGNETY